ncbi:hypothetical protein [Nonomuraea sp. NPDC005650]|uniref:hypothetical protein n=1 Tax=Nonomuraea sp. NPDC005650 TaxID=3157045 RepID=UPI0033B66C48
MGREAEYRHGRHVLSAFGAGMGLAVAPLAQLTLENIPARHAGSGSGLVNTVAQVAASTGVAVIGTIFFPLLATHAGEPAHGYGTAFGVTMWVSIALLALTVAAGFLLPRKPAPGSGVQHPAGP